MAAESNTGFHHQLSLDSAINPHAISFQSSALNSTSEMILMGNYYGVTSTTAGMMFSGNSSTVNSNPGINQAAKFSGSVLVDSVPGLKLDTGLAVEWSVEEQYKLEQGLVKYADEPRIMRYIKVAATLRDKTVRDVALRCRWMTDKLGESSLKTNISSASPLNVAAYSLIMNHGDQRDGMPCDALNGTMRQLLEQNYQVLGQISANLLTLKLQDNIDLFCRMRSNIIAILNDIGDIPGAMNQMPALPLSINEELANSILPSSTQVGGHIYSAMH